MPIAACLSGGIGMIAVIIIAAAIATVIGLGIQVAVFVKNHRNPRCPTCGQPCSRCEPPRCATCGE